MIDGEFIIKAFEQCFKKTDIIAKCRNIDGHIVAVTIGDILGVMNRQKAEIESLKREIPNRKYANCVKVRNGMIYTKTLDDYDWLIGDISAEAIKEFVYRVEECVKPSKSYPFESLVGMSDIYSIKKEMLGEG